MTPEASSPRRIQGRGRTLMRYRELVLIVVGWLLCASFSLHAQTNFGAIRGRVIDPSGSVLPGVTVKVTSVNKNQPRETRSDGLGNYIVPSLEPGSYIISAAGAGFATTERGPLVLLTG